MTKKFGADFPIFEKVNVWGPHINPIFHFLKNHTKEFNTGVYGEINRNFTLFIANSKEEVIRFFLGGADLKQVEDAIREMLNIEINK